MDNIPLFLSKQAAETFFVEGSLLSAEDVGMGLGLGSGFWVSVFGSRIQGLRLRNSDLMAK